MAGTSTSDRTRSATRGALIVSGEPFDASVALLCGTAGTATITMAGGSILTDFPLQQGWNPMQATKVVLGTASNVWAMWN
jgi:hypothetical protein